MCLLRREFKAIARPLATARRRVVIKVAFLSCVERARLRWKCESREEEKKKMWERGKEKTRRKTRAADKVAVKSRSSDFGPRFFFILIANIFLYVFSRFAIKCYVSFISFSPRFFFHRRSVLVKLSIRTRDRFDGPVRRDATRGVSGFQTWNNRCANLSRRPVSPQGRRRPSRPLCIDTPIESEPHATNLFPRIVPSSRRAARCARERAFTCMRAGARERSYYASLIRKKG